MQYNRNMFGEGIKVYNHGTSATGQTLYDFTIGSQNANLSAAYNSEAMKNNKPLPDDLFYWLASEDSPYNRMSFIYRTGTSPNFEYQKIDTPEHKAPIPLVLWAGATKINPNTYDVDIESGTLFSTYANNSRLIFNSSTFNMQTSQAPLWELNYGHSISVYANGVYSSLPFILDFDYNNFILIIRVGQGNSFADLADYQNDDSHYIDSIAIELYTGDVSTGNARVSRQNRTDENGTNIIFGDAQNDCYYVITDFDYKTPEVYTENYQYPTYRKLARLGTSTVHILFSGTNVTSNLLNAMPYFFIEDDKWELVNGSYRLKKNGNNVYSEDDFNYIRKLIAYLGFWFTDGGIYNDTEHSYSINRVNSLLGDSANTYTNEYMIPDKIFQSEIKDGITTGNFTELRIAKDNDQSKWGTEWRDKNGYEGRSGSDENRNRGDLTTVLNRGTIGGSVKWFALTETELNDLIKWTNSGYQPQNNDQFVLDYKGTNPAEYITTAMYMPFVPKTTGALRDIFIGPLNTGVQGTQLDYEYGITINLGYHKLDREYNDFRDYKPYTNISLYVPFCGTVELDAAKIYGMTINVKLMVDIATGSCTGLIFADELLIDTVSGQLGVKLPLNVFNMSDYQDTIINAAYNLKSAERSKDAALIGTYAGAIVAGATSGTGIGLLAGAAGIALGQQKYNNAVDAIENIKYNVQHTQPKQTQISTADAANLLGMERNARLIITRPYPIETDISAYGHTMGFACNKQGVLSDFTGFTAVSACDTSGINATAREKEKILTLLKSGVIIK